MTKLPRVSILLAVLAMVFATSGRAQLLTADTLAGWTGVIGNGNSNVLDNGGASTQTFSGISSIENLTFRFVAADTANFSSTSLLTYFSEWNVGNTSVTGGNLGSESFLIAASGSWTDFGDGFMYYDATVDLSAFATGLNPSLTYGLSIVGNAVSHLVINLSGSLVDYAGGIGNAHGPTISSYADLLASGTIGGNDFAFSASALAPVPEASTVAVVFAGVFVGLMVGVRIRQRRLQDALPAQA